MAEESGQQQGTQDTTAQQASAPQGGGEAMVPSYRLREATEAKAALEARVRELEQQMQAERATWAETESIYKAGLTDPQAIAVARLLHSQLPEADRPKLPDWIASMKADPSKAPPALAWAFAAPAPPQPTAAAPEAGAPVEPRNMGATRNGTNPTGSSGGGPLSREQALARLTQLGKEAQRTGDWSAYDREKGELLGRLMQV